MAGNSEKSGTRIAHHNPGADALGKPKKGWKRIWINGLWKKIIQF